MRVIGGTRRSLPLKTIPSNKTRPTTDRIKETLFNMLSPYLSDVRFLDLFAGSGAIGIEALSRGAKEAVFVDQSRECTQVIRENLTFTKFLSEATVYTKDCFSYLRSYEGEPFDIIFMDPPYNNEFEKQALEIMKDSPLLKDSTLIIFEASKNTDISYLFDMGYILLKDKSYGSNRHVWLRRKEK